MSEIAIMKIHKEQRMSLIGFGILFSVFYWILESVRDVLVFEKGNLVERLFFPDTMSFWMRFLVVCVLVLFGAIAQSQKGTKDEVKKKKNRYNRLFGPVRTGLGIGLLYWGLESFRDVFVFGRGSLLERFFAPDPLSLWMRALAVFIILLFTLYAQTLIIERRKAEESLLKEQEKLSKMVEERTTELTESNRLLRRLRNEMGERSRAEAALQRSEEKYRTLTENINTGIYRNTPGEEGRFIEVNPYLVRMFGYKNKEELLQVSVSDLYHNPEDRKRFNKKILQNGFVRDEEIRLKKKEGSLLWGSVTAIAVYDENGKPLYYDGVIEDITERKKLEQEIERRKKYLESVLANAPSAIVTNDHRSIVTEWNPGAEQIFGYRREEALGKKVGDLIGGKDMREEVEALSERMLSGKRIHPSESIRYRKDGSRVPVMVTGSPIQVGGGSLGVIVVYTDISELKEAEREKEKIQEQLIQAKKMESIGILAGGIAHDFNNLMTAILGCADLAMMELNANDSVYQDLMEIRLSAERAADLTRQLLLFSRKQPMKFVSVNLNIVIQDMLTMLRRLIGENIKIHTELSADLWSLGGDQSSLEQVIMNLAVNARDAMPQGGQLIIETQNVTLSKEDCRAVPDARPGKFVQLTVSDTGTGMDKGLLQHIFDPFFSTKTVGKGTGLGLSVIYGVVRQHEGWIDVTSTPKRGSTFKVYLPLGFIEQEQTTRKVVSVEDLVGVGKRILVVEDEEKVREFTTSGLNRNGYVAVGAADAEEALTLFIKEKGRFHMVLSDVALPGKSGLDMVDDLLDYDPKLRVLFISGYGDHDSRWPKIREKGFRFLEKPYALNDLLRVVQEVVESKN
jgi:two-component system cell cycle sensor histidine kinase/response regulator CckA